LPVGEIDLVSDGLLVVTESGLETVSLPEAYHGLALVKLLSEVVLALPDLAETESTVTSEKLRRQLESRVDEQRYIATEYSLVNTKNGVREVVGTVSRTGVLTMAGEIVFPGKVKTAPTQTRPDIYISANRDSYNYDGSFFIENDKFWVAGDLAIYHFQNTTIYQDTLPNHNILQHTR
jgi:hypothetical protein